MFERLIRRAVNQEIEARLADIPKPLSPPQGYNSLEVIRGGMYHWVYAPVNNTFAWIQLRTSNATQLESGDAVTLIESLRNVNKATPEEMIDMRNNMEEICRITMNNPTFDEFVQMITDTDVVHSQKRLEIKRLKAIDCTGMSATEKDIIDTEIRKHELHLAFLLPENTFDFIVKWALGVDVSDISKVSHEKLLEAAILAKRNGNAPHENIKGCFTDRDPSDLDKASWNAYDAMIEDQRISKGIR